MCNGRESTGDYGGLVGRARVENEHEKAILISGISSISCSIETSSPVVRKARFEESDITTRAIGNFIPKSQIPLPVL